MEQKLGLDLLPEISDGKYANLGIVTHSPMEFVIDFASMLPGRPKPRVVSRVILTPTNAKQIAAMLLDNIRRYENTFGEIKTPEPPSKTATPFGPVKGNA